MEGSGDEGGLMELLGSGDLLCPVRDEGNLFCQLSPSLCSPDTSCSSASFIASLPTSNGMLCFAGDSSLSTVSSSSPHSTSTTSTSSRASRKVEIAGGKGGRRTTAAAVAVAVTGTSKKPKKEASARPGTMKVRKEKLGERIVALQQLVCPFGKTDTASVLHEALSYIQFLHDQVQVLSTPYLQRLPSSARMHEGGRGEEERGNDDLRSRGLCLVPVSCTEHVANSSRNGADFWASTMGNSSSSN